MSLRFCFSVIVAFLVIFITDYLFHGILLTDAYEATSDLWRTTEAMQEFIPICLAVQGLLAIIATFIFTRHYEDKGIGEGARFGLYIGALLAVPQFGMVAYMPIPMTLAMSWFAVTLVQWFLVGCAIALTYNRAKAKG